MNPKNPKKARKTSKLLKTLKKIKLKDLIDESSEIFEQANARIKNLEAKGLQDFSRALQAYRDEGGTYFGEMPKRRITKYDILNELYAARTFLSDITSTEEGVLTEKAYLIKSSWSNQLGKIDKDVVKNYKELKPQQAKLAFAIYRRLEQYDRALIYGKAAYGSEGTIALVFEMTKDFYYDISELTNTERSEYIDKYLAEMEQYITAQRRTIDPYSIYNYKEDYSRVNKLINNVRRGVL